MAKHQNRTHKRYDKKSVVSSPETNDTPAVNGKSNASILSPTLKSPGQVVTAVSNNQDMIIRDIKKIGILTGVIILIVVILSIALPR